MKYYAELVEKVRHFGRNETITRWIAFNSKNDWPIALARHVKPESVVSLNFFEEKPADVEAELMW